MRRWTATLVGLASLATASAEAAKSDPRVKSLDAPISTTICKILADPSQFDGRRIRAEGGALTDYRHFSGVGDPACPKSYLPFGGSRRPIVGEEDFERALLQVRGAATRQVIFTAEGVVHAHPGENPSVTLAVEGVYDVRIVPK